MNCNEAQARMLDSLNGISDPAAEQHVNGCELCRKEMENVRETWQKLGEFPEPEPGPHVRARFYQMLEAYQEGLNAASAKRETRSRWFAWQPAWQMAAAVALLSVGLAGGRFWSARQSSPPDVVALRSEVQNMRQLVALSLLQQQSASDRLRGVTYSYRVESSDTEVLSALLRTVNNDPNVNVRLSAVDALRQFAASPVARRGMGLALGKQDSPLVQVALLSALSEMQDRDALPYVQALAQKTGADSTVRSRAAQVAETLQKN